MGSQLLGTLGVKLSADSTEFNQRIDAAKEKLHSVSATARSVAVKSAVAFAGIAGIGGIFAKTASDAIENLNVIETTFGKKLTPVVLDWSKKSAEAMGRSELQMATFAGRLQSVIRPMVGSKEAASGMSTALSGLAVDLGSFYNVADDDALIALRAGLVGEMEPMKRFGVVMTEAALKMFALKQGIQKSVAEMSIAEKTALRYQFIMAHTTDAQGDAAKTHNTFANVLKSLGGLFTDISQSIGQAMLPALTDMAITIRDAMKWFKKLSPATYEFIGYAILAAGAVTGLITIFAGAVAVVAMLAASMSAVVLVAQGLVVVALAAGAAFLFLSNSAKPGETMLQRISRAFTEIGDAVHAVWSQYIEPFISGIVEGFSPVIQVLSEVWHSVKASVIDAMTTIREALGTSAESAKVDWFSVGEAVGSAIAFVVGGVASLIEALAGLAAWAAPAVVPVGKALYKLVATPLRIIHEALGLVYDGFKDLFSGDILSGLKKIGLGLADGILWPVRTVLGILTDLFNDFIEYIPKKLKRFLPESFEESVGKFTATLKKFADKGVSGLLGVGPKPEQGADDSKRRRKKLSFDLPDFSGFQLAGNKNTSAGLEGGGRSALIDDIKVKLDQEIAGIGSELAEQINGAATEIGPTIADGMKYAGETLTSAFVSNVEGLGDVIEGAKAGMEAGGPWGAVIGAIVALLQRTEAFSTVIDLANTGLEFVVKSLDEFIKPLMPLVHIFHKSIMIGMQLAKTTHMFGITTEILAKAFEWVAGLFNTIQGSIINAFNWVIEKLAKWVGKIKGSWGDSLRKLKIKFEDPDATNGIDVLGDKLGGLGDIVMDTEDNMSKLNESLLNAPEGFKVAAAAYQAIDASGDAPTFVGDTASQGATTINIQVDSSEEAADIIIDRLEQRGYSETGNIFGDFGPKRYAVSTGGA